MKKQVTKLLSFLIRLSVASLLGSSVLSGLVPTVAIASAFGVETGSACCIGKAAGHCKLSLKVKRQTATEQMCGLKQPASDEAVTVVAHENDDGDAENISFAFVGSTCDHNCSSCAARSTQRTKQFKRASVARSTSTWSTQLSYFEANVTLVKSSGKLEIFSPRGPPSFSCSN